MALIYVANVDHRSTEANLRSAFEVYGRVEAVKLLSGFAFIEMSDDAQAQLAIYELNRYTSWVVRSTAAVA